MAIADAHVDTLARTYAQSLFDLAEAGGGRAKVEEIAAELDEVLNIARSDRAVAEFFNSRIISTASRSKSLEAVFSGRTDTLTLRFLVVLNRKGRLAGLGSIVAAYHELLQERFGRVEVDVYTAAPIDEALLGSIKRRLEAALGKEPVLHPYTDTNMLGGLKLQIGDQLIDASVSTQLRRVRERLANEGSARVRSSARRFFDDVG